MLQSFDGILLNFFVRLVGIMNPEPNQCTYIYLQQCTKLNNNE